MKITKLLAIITTLCATTQLHAITVPNNVTQVITLNARMTIQNTNQTDIRGVTTVFAPKVRLITTGGRQAENDAAINLLHRMAVDENLAGNWPSNSFPVGAQFAVKNGDFFVIKGTNVLVDVSNIVGGSQGTNAIVSGRVSDLTGLASPVTTKVHLLTFTFDDTSINTTNGLKFSVTGVMTETTIDTAVVNNKYTETRAAVMPVAVGEGMAKVGSGNDETFVIQGSVTATGVGKFNFTGL